MLTPSQIRLVKMAQRLAGLGDADYRDAIATATGLADCTSSKDPRLGDDQFDRVMSYLEAIYWRAVDTRAELRTPNSEFRPRQPFLRRGYWAAKNRAGNTSRDRYSAEELQARCTAAETELRSLHLKPAGWFAEVRRRTGPGWPYFAALQRTLTSLRRASEQQDETLRAQRLARAARASGSRVYVLKR